MRWKVETRKIEDLYENPENPRQISEDSYSQLAESLNKFGLCEPIVVQPDGKIIGGHQRKRALQQAGKTYVEVSVPESPLSDRDADELSIRLNKNKGSWDYDILANAWETDLLLESGFTDNELHLELVEEKKTKKKKKPQIVLTFESEYDLRLVESEIEGISLKYQIESIDIKI